MLDQYKDGLHWTSQQEFLKGIDTAPNAKFLVIGRYPSQEVLLKSDGVVKELMPPIDIWDEFREAGERGNLGGGWHRFEGKYLEYLQHDSEAYRKAQQLKALAKVRPVWLIGTVNDEVHSEAKLLKNYIEGKVELPA